MQNMCNASRSWCRLELRTVLVFTDCSEVYENASHDTLAACGSEHNRGGVSTASAAFAGLRCAVAGSVRSRSCILEDYGCLLEHT
jgi:hypothetical protein